MPIRIALGEGSSIVVRRAAAARCRPEVASVAAVANLPSLLEACDEGHPDVVLSDIRMPPTPHRRGGGAAAEIDKATQLLDGGAIAQARFDASRPRRSRSAQRS
jgi:CheY-like chemotaxis protein